MLKYWMIAFFILIILLVMYLLLNTSVIQDSLSSSPIIPQGLLTKNKIVSKECLISLQPPQSLKIQFEEKPHSCTISSLSDNQDYAFTLSGSIDNWDEVTRPYLETGIITTIGGKKVFLVQEAVTKDTSVQDIIFLKKGDFVFYMTNSYRSDDDKGKMYLENILSSLEFTGSEKEYLQVTN